MIIAKHTYAILFLIVLLGVFLRFYNFPNNPPSLNWDEVSTGYNAHSILLTGKDEYGKAMPLFFRSLDDYKLPFTIYLTVISEAVFGYGDFAVRFPALFFGIGTIVLMYFLCFELTKNKLVSLLSAFFLAILPWHVAFSKFALEPTIALFFLTLGTLFFIRATRKDIWLLPVSAILFWSCTYTYFSFRAMVPLFVAFLFFFYFKKLWRKKIPLVVTIIILSISVVFLASESLQQSGQTRFKGTSVLNNVDAFTHELQEMQYEGTLGINLPRRFFHEVPLFINARLMFRGYLTHFSPDFLFFDYGRKVHAMPIIGLLYLWMVLFIPIGIYFLIKKYTLEAKSIFMALFLIAPIPASVTFDVPSETRVMTLVLPFSVFAAVGVYEIFSLVQKRNKILYIVGIIVFIATVGIQTWYFFRQYQIHLPHEMSKEWVYGRKELASYLQKSHLKYDKIHISQSLEWPYIFLLYYMQYDPKKYLAQGGTLSGGFAFEGNHFDNYQFHTLNFKRIPPNDLYVGKPEEFPKGVLPLHIIYYLDKTSAMYIVTSKELVKNVVLPVNNN